MKSLQRASLFLLAIGLAGCGALNSMHSVAADPLGVRGQAPRGAQSGGSNPSGWETTHGRSNGVLYARDGSPVGQAPAGVATATEPLPRGLHEEPPGSRIQLLDLYQEAIDNRDELLLELELRDQLQMQSNARVKELEAQLEARQKSLDEALAKQEELTLQNFELADRLATATVLRLEAEKKYLESAIAARTSSLERAGVEVPEGDQ